MKALVTVLFTSLISVTAFAQSSSHQCNGLGRDANGGCNTEPVQQTCSAGDSYGNVYSSSNYGVGSTVWAQYHAIKACRTQSPAPRTCRPRGCE